VIAGQDLAKESRGGNVVQALSLAFAGSFYPVGLLFVLRYLAAHRALLLAGLFLVGGALGCLIVSVAEYGLLNALPLKQSEHPAANGAVYVVLGGGLLVGAAFFALRPRRPAEIEGEPIRPADPHTAKAFLTGLIIYSPGLGLIAAIKALYDADLSGFDAAVGIALCTAIILWMAEVPIAATVVSPRRSAPVLRTVGSFVARNGRTISIAIAMLFGVYLLADGISTIISK
jgi:Sap, sulfolipid-1-addressing protein